MIRHHSFIPFGWGRRRQAQRSHGPEQECGHGHAGNHTHTHGADQSSAQPRDEATFDGAPAPVCPLTMAETGTRFRVVSIAAGHQATHRLAELGIIPGVEVGIIQGQGRGPLLLAVRDTRLAVERGIAHKILVQPLSQELPQPCSALNGKTKPHETTPRRPCW